MADDLLFYPPANLRVPQQGSRQGRGPDQSRISLKVYYLPDASMLPLNFKLSNELVKQHMEQGFGKFTLILLSFLGERESGLSLSIVK